MDKKSTIEIMNKLGSKRTPFVFIIDFKMQNNVVIPITDIKEHRIQFQVNNNGYTHKKAHEPYLFSKKPITFKQYKKSFNHVHTEISKGNSYLTNLTCQTEIETDLSLKDIYNKSNAKYKLLYKDDFVVFSPETFIEIKRNKIYSYPMKGTIDANIPNSEQLILENKKEAAEHATITDLIRNDLSTVATNIAVEKYRYIDKIKTNESDLLQVSSVISGCLPLNYNSQIGTILFKLLPAGSISGAPKQKTLHIIDQAEDYERGYYTGVFGVFNGNELDCSVMIRFIEKNGSKLIYKSGGGITINSKAQDEYLEMIKKVYLPF